MTGREGTTELDSAGVYYISVEDFERRAPPEPETDVTEDDDRAEDPPASAPRDSRRRPR